MRCVGHARRIQSQSSRGDKDEKTLENYSTPWCYRPSAELGVRDRTVLKTLGKEERPLTILYSGSRLSIGICPRHCVLLKWLFFPSDSSERRAANKMNCTLVIRKYGGEDIILLLKNAVFYWTNLTLLPFC